MKERYQKRIPFTSENLLIISQIDELKGLWKGTTSLSPQILKRLKKSVIITSTGASTRIEGSQMTDLEVERFLAALTVNPPENRDQEEVAGYANLLGRIFDHAKTLRLSESLILQFHEILLHYSQKDEIHKGKYKTKENVVVARNARGEQVTIFAPTPPWLVKKEMDDVLYWAVEAFSAKEFHPLLIIANFIFEFLAIHPFTDGNGRLSRALTNMLLLQVGYDYIPYVSLEEIVEERKDSYYASLRQAQKHHKTEHENISSWLSFFLNTFLTQGQMAQQLLTSDDPTMLLSPRQVDIYNLFDTKELSVVAIHDKLPDVHEQTIKQALRRLVSLKLIVRIGLGRGTRYVKATPNPRLHGNDNQH